MNLEELVLASGFSICKVTGAWSGGVSCRRELEKFAELVRGEDTQRLDWLETTDGRFANIDRITSAHGPSSASLASSQMHSTRFTASLLLAGQADHPQRLRYQPQPPR